MKYFIIVRILDVITTLYGINHGQYEFNPYNNWLLNQGVSIFLLWNIVVIWIIGKLYHHKLVKLTVKIFTIINALVILMNIVLLLLVFLTEKGLLKY